MFVFEDHIMNSINKNRYYESLERCFDNNNAANEANACLTERQKEVLMYLLLGYTAKKIALVLGISFRTVESYIETLKLKLNCQTKGDLIERTIRTGLVYDLLSILERHFRS
jgi:DNA-binding CsgD family transcriptional regulator